MLRFEVDLNKAKLGDKRKEVVRFVNWWLRGLAEEIQDTAQDLAPRDTGLLESSIDVFDMDLNPAPLYQIHQHSTKRGETYYIATPVYYSWYQEFGFTQRNGVWNFGNPFLRPAFYQKIAGGIKGMGKIGGPLQKVLDGP